MQANYSLYCTLALKKKMRLIFKKFRVNNAVPLSIYNIGQTGSKPKKDVVRNKQAASPWPQEPLVCVVLLWILYIQ